MGNSFTYHLQAFLGVSTHIDIEDREEDASSGLPSPSSGASTAPPPGLARSTWLGSPACLLDILRLTAQAGHSAKGFQNLTRAFRYDPALWEQILLFHCSGECGVVEDCGVESFEEGSGEESSSGIDDCICAGKYFMAAARVGDAERVAWLGKVVVESEGGASTSIHTFSVTNATLPGCGTTALMLACEGGHEGAARVLLGLGASDSPVSHAGLSALHLSAREGSIGLTRLLIELGGGSVNAPCKDRYGWTPLMLAARGGHARCASLLLGLGAEVGAVDTPSGMTALHWAAYEGHTEVVRVLGWGGAAVDARTGHGKGQQNTPLMLATLGGHLGCITLLLAMGARTDLKNGKGQDALGCLGSWSGMAEAGGVEMRCREALLGGVGGSGEVWALKRSITV